MSKVVLGICAASLVLMLVPGCGNTPPSVGHPPSGVEHRLQADTDLPLSDEELFVSRPQRRSFTTWRLADLEASKLFRERNYPALEALASELRDSQVRDSEGQWRLRSFYYAVSVPLKESERAYLEFISRLREWETQFPQSVTAKTALAEAWTYYAWQARGTGWANTVSEDGWRRMKERLQVARRYALASMNQPETCPEANATLHSYLLAEGSRSEYEAMIESAILQTPTYTDYYLCYAYCLLPRWKGAYREEWLHISQRQLHL